MLDGVVTLTLNYITYLRISVNVIKSWKRGQIIEDVGSWRFHFMNMHSCVRTYIHVLDVMLCTGVESLKIMHTEDEQ